MADVRPFRALRPRPDVAARVASPPYDVLSSEEARVMAAGNPYAFLHVSKPEIDLSADVDLHSDEVYARGRENLDRFVADGVLFRDAAPAYYLYEQQMGDHVQIGLVAGASVEEYENNLIRKHELTRRDKEDDRTRHIDALEAQTGPVFLTYKVRPEIDAIVSRLSTAPPTYDFVAPDGIQHVVWVIADPRERDRLVEAFAPVPEMYVADGHHRSAAATRVRAQRRQANPGHTGEEGYNFFLAVIFPHDQMQILDYNRVLKDLNGREPEAFLAQLRTSFELTPVASGRPGRQRCFGMYLAGKWYRLTAKAGTYATDDPVQSLDVAILQDNLLGPVLGIGDPRKDERIDFVGGIRGLGELERLVDSGRFAVAFAVHPTSIEQLFAVADAGRVMPPKSTWFEPKLRDGLIIRPLED